MRFYTGEECEEWLHHRKRQKPEASASIHVERIIYPREPYRMFFLARWVASMLTHRVPCLLWISEWSIWPSGEKWHLYYRLRHSYGDQRLLPEAPGHLFLEYEVEDLASFPQLSLLNGWGGYVLTDANYVNAFFSHDEYIDFFAADQANLDVVRRELRREDN